MTYYGLDTLNADAVLLQPHSDNTEEISVILDSDTKTYSPGQVVKGQLLLNPKKTSFQNIQGILISFEGIGAVSWLEEQRITETVPTYNDKGTFEPRHILKSKTVRIAATEDYIRRRMLLRRDGNNQISSAPESNSYPFLFKLPKNLPSTFTHEFGSVSYTLKVEIISTPHVRRTAAVTPIHIEAALDLTDQPQVKKEQNVNEVDSEAGVSFGVRLKQSGFVPGEKIDFVCELRNSGCNKVNYVRASLQQTLTFTAEGQGKTCSTTIFEMESPPVYSGSFTSWTSPNRLIPPLPPSGLGGGCTIIAVEYSVQFHVSISGFILNNSIHATLPIKIGTISLSGVM